MHRSHLIPFLDVSGLYEWSCWLTPLNMTNTKSSGRRFDTLFYTHFINDPVEVDLDNQEVTESVWTSPAEALEAYTEKKVWLAPPQVWELSRMRNFSKFDELKNFAQDREARGTPTWLPGLVTNANIICWLLVRSYFIIFRRRCYKLALRST